MSRHLVGHQPGAERRYVIEAFGNRETSDPIAVHIRQPTEREKREIATIGSEALFEVSQNGEILRDEQGNARIKMLLDQQEKRNRAILERFVTRVENYSYAGLPITDGVLLHEHGESDIVHEVVGEIMSKLQLSTQEKKHYAAPHSSLPATILPSAEIASTANYRGLANSGAVSLEELQTT